MREHTHRFGALWWNLGPAGRQDIHLHPCAAESCEVELVGLGHTCDEDKSTHVRKLLTSRSRWSQRAEEGKPLGKASP